MLSLNSRDDADLGAEGVSPSGFIPPGTDRHEKQTNSCFKGGKGAGLSCREQIAKAQK